MDCFLVKVYLKMLITCDILTLKITFHFPEIHTSLHCLIYLFAKCGNLN